MYDANLKQKQKQLRAMNAELEMYKGRVRDLQGDIAGLNADQDRLKRRYFAQMRAAQRGDGGAGAGGGSTSGGGDAGGGGGSADAMDVVAEYAAYAAAGGVGGGDGDGRASGSPESKGADDGGGLGGAVL